VDGAGVSEGDAICWLAACSPGHPYIVVDIRCAAITLLCSVGYELDPSNQIQARNAFTGAILLIAVTDLVNNTCLTVRSVL
jgi:hypothetical protein